MRTFLAIAVLALASSVAAQSQTINQGAPGHQGPWPVYISLLPDGGGGGSGGGGSSPLCPFTVVDNSAVTLFTVNCDGSIQGAGSYPEFFVGRPFPVNTLDWSVLASQFSTVTTLYPDGGTDPFEASFESAMPSGYDAMLANPGAYICWSASPTDHTHCIRSTDGGSGTQVLDVTNQRITNGVDGVDPTDYATVEQISGNDPYWNDAGFVAGIGAQTVNNRNFPGQYIIGDGVQVAPIAAPLATQSHVNNGPMISFWDNNNRGGWIAQLGLDIQFVSSANTCGAFAPDGAAEGSTFKACFDRDFAAVPLIADGGLSLGNGGAGTISNLVAVTAQGTTNPSFTMNQSNSVSNDGWTFIQTTANSVGDLITMRNGGPSGTIEWAVGATGVVFGNGGFDFNSQKGINVAPATVTTNAVNFGQLQIAFSGSIQPANLVATFASVTYPLDFGDQVMTNAGTITSARLSYLPGTTVGDQSVTWQVFDSTTSTALCTFTDTKGCTSGTFADTKKTAMTCSAPTFAAADEVYLRIASAGTGCNPGATTINALYH